MIKSQLNYDKNRVFWHENTINDNFIGIFKKTAKTLNINENTIN